MIRVFLLIMLMMVLTFSRNGHLGVTDVKAQAASPVNCGTVKEGTFTGNRQTATYTIQLSENERLFADAEVIRGNLGIVVSISKPDKTVISGETNTAYGELFYQAQTPIIYASGTYTITVGSETDGGGIFAIYISCLRADNSIVSDPSNRFVKGVSCPDTIKSKIGRVGEIHRYFALLEPLVILQTSVEVAKANSDNLRLIISLGDPQGASIGGNANTGYADVVYKAVSPALNSKGVYSIGVYSTAKNRGIGGEYTFAVGCTKNGSPYTTPSIQLKSPNPAPIENPSGPTNVPGGVSKGSSQVLLIDPTKAIPIPVTVGTAITGTFTPSSNELYGYQVDAKANDNLDLAFKRLVGNLNIGVVVLSPDNEILYQANTIKSSSMNATVPLPKDGKYTVVIFRSEFAAIADAKASSFQLLLNLKQ